VIVWYTINYLDKIVVAVAVVVGREKVGQAGEEESDPGRPSARA
jgi:hypothetical protein